MLWLTPFLVGSQGSLLDNRFHSNFLHGEDRQKWKELPFKPVDSGDVSDHSYQAELEAFLAALAQGEEMPLTGLREAVRKHSVFFAAMRSEELKQPVNMQEVKFTD